MSSIEPTQYQPEIDGLRAIAISAVVLFHLDVTWLNHGYLGVDMFFALSGFLITRMIQQQLQQQTFQLKDFYIRRLRRLFPAYIFTIVLTLLLFAWVFPELRYRNLNDSALYSVFHLSNFYWALQGVNYFGSGIEVFRPLLHLWSLSVEEQFYIVWPILLLLGYKIRRRWLWAFYLSALIVLIYLPERLINNEAIQDRFFYPHLRFFEFAIGAFTYVFGRRLFALNNAYKEILLLIGLFTLAVLFSGQISSQLFQGSFFGTSIVTCLATSCCLLGCQANMLGRLLKFRPIVGLGVISYSLYLLHWPLISFYRFVLYQAEMRSIVEQIVVLLICLFAAYLCHRFIEQPFRLRKTNQAGAPVTPAALPRTGSFLLFFAVSQVLVVSAVLLPRYINFETWRVKNQKITTIKQPLCANQNKRGSPWSCNFRYGLTNQLDLLVVGDSHLIKLRSAFKDVSIKEQLNTKIRISIGCAPLLNVSFLKRGRPQHKCNENKQTLLNQLNKFKPKLVVLVGSWGTYFENYSHYGVRRSSIKGLRNDAVPDWSAERTFVQAMTDTAHIVSQDNRRVIILSSIPTLPHQPIDCYALPSLFSKLINVNARCWPTDSQSKMLSLQHNIQNIVEQVSNSSPSVDYLHLGHYLCEPDTLLCQFLNKNGESLYKDHNHLSLAGRKHIHNQFVSDLRELLMQN